MILCDGNGHEINTTINLCLALKVYSFTNCFSIMRNIPLYPKLTVRNQFIENIFLFSNLSANNYSSIRVSLFFSIGFIDIWSALYLYDNILPTILDFKYIFWKQLLDWKRNFLYTFLPGQLSLIIPEKHFNIQRNFSITRCKSDFLRPSITANI